MFTMNMSSQIFHLFIWTLREKSPNTELFMVRFSCIWIEHGDLRRKYPYSVQTQENTDHK